KGRSGRETIEIWIHLQPTRAVSPRKTRDEAERGMCAQRWRCPSRGSQGRRRARPLVVRNNAARSDRSTPEEHFMKAIVYTQCGPPDVLQFEEVATPTPA